MIEILMGITIVVLFGVYIALLVAFSFFVRETNAEKSKLINAIIAKTPEQARDLTLADKFQMQLPKKDEPELIPESELSQEEWERAVKNTTE